MADPWSGTANGGEIIQAGRDQPADGGTGQGEFSREIKSRRLARD